MSVARIAILGAESSGKSTLATALASHYGTVWVPEYLREFVETQGRVPFEHDQYGIARTQLDRENAAAPGASRFLFCDTTPLMTAIYSLAYWGRIIDEQLEKLASTHAYALTLVAAPDVPWSPDGLQRDGIDMRGAVHRLVLETLDERRIPFVQVGGDLPQRLRQVQALLAQKSNWADRR